MKTEQESSEGGQYPISQTCFRVRDIPEQERPRELADRVGVENVSDHVLIALILRSGVRGRNVIQIAEELLRKYGSLQALARVSTDELAQQAGVGRVRAQVLKAALEIGLRAKGGPSSAGKRITTPSDVADVMHALIRLREEESFWLLILDVKNRMKQRPLEISRGTLDASLVHPREVFREAVRTAGAAVILVHNHPSGDPAPSPDDIRVTRTLIECGKIVDIRVLDHIILGCDPQTDALRYISMREDGLAPF